MPIFPLISLDKALLNVYPNTLAIDPGLGKSRLLILWICLFDFGEYPPVKPEKAIGRVLKCLCCSIDYLIF